jgi:surface antigen
MAVLVGTVGLVVGTASLAAAADTGGYPYWSMPCVWSPYATSGPAGYCADYDWGTIKGNDSAKSVQSPYGYDYRNCTDYVAWRLSTLGVEPAQYMGFGNAKRWGQQAARHGLVDNDIPAVGSVAVSTTGSFGHVAFVTAVSGKTIMVSEYNKHENGSYSTQSGPPDQLGFSSFVHFEQYESNSVVSVAYNPTNGLPVIAVEGANNSLVYWYQQSGTGSWGSTSLGSAFSAPSVAYNPTNGLPVIAVEGANNSLVYWYQQSGTGSWGSTSLGSA